MSPGHTAPEGVELKSKLCPELCPIRPLPNPHKDGDQEGGKEEKGVRRLERGSRGCPQASGPPPYPGLAWMEDPRGRGSEAALVLSRATASGWATGCQEQDLRHLLSAARDQGRMGDIANPLHPPVATPGVWPGQGGIRPGQRHLLQRTRVRTLIASWARSEHMGQPRAQKAKDGEGAAACMSWDRNTASSQACGPWLLSDPASASPTKGTRQVGLAPWLRLDVPREREQTHGREGLGSSLEEAPPVQHGQERGQECPSSSHPKPRSQGGPPDAGGLLLPLGLLGGMWPRVAGQVVCAGRLLHVDPH